MKKISSLFLVIVLVFSNINHVKAGDIPVIGTSGIAIDADTGTILWEKNKDDKKAVASTTKIMTAIVALENGNLYDFVTVTEYAASMPSTKMYLKKGEIITLENLLYALLLQSSNDAAAAIADHIAGSEIEFAKMMTEKAIELGAFNTYYVTASGLDDDVEPFSTAYDLAIITKYALKNPEFLKIINTEKIGFETSHRKYFVENKNWNLRTDFENIIGKTGYTSKAGHCFVSIIEFNNTKIISVILGSNNNGKWDDTKGIINFTKTLYSDKEVIIPKIKTELFSELGVRKGDLYLNEQKYNFFTTLADYSRIKKEIIIVENIKEPITENIKLGSIKITLDDMILLENDIFYNDFILEQDKIIMENVIKNK